MAEKRDERLINKDPRAVDEDENQETGLPFFKQPAFIFVLKISLSLGVISSLLTGLFITNSRLTDVEDQILQYQEEISVFKEQQDILKQNLQTLTADHEYLVSEVNALDLSAAQGDLSKALAIYDQQADALNKQLAVTRNGLMSLSRMIKGSRVWQEDYNNQYKKLFEDNKQIQQAIDELRGVQKDKAQREEPQYLEIDF
ncbi:hypothetical protein HF888_04635 [Bermanella marisrubri]|uniref:Uncharacterized protein n=1 Tax=Bermanella marisrubri TaxID=207949 RepID=Q1N1G7_9GAMM|nr:hypothetical protein [Bermanella marisrubri]EAT12083.1 hypothetical protein RED65_03555 [Oceanobacter sp. RED65] [Bermanella marisrubri]QIZ83549.1 hypothetical protein HF888_04635 [Bermanella marisrubri]